MENDGNHRTGTDRRAAKTHLAGGECPKGGNASGRVASDVEPSSQRGPPPRPQDPRGAEAEACWPGLRDAAMSEPVERRLCRVCQKRYVPLSRAHRNMKCSQCSRDLERARLYQREYRQRPDVKERLLEPRRRWKRKAWAEGRTWEQRPENQLRAQLYQDRYNRKRALQTLTSRLTEKGIDGV